MSAKRKEQRSEAKQRKLEERMMNDPAYERCPKCRAYNRFDIKVCWKCGAKICE